MYQISYKLSIQNIKICNLMYQKTQAVAATVDFMVSRICPIAPLLLLLDHYGPIRDTIKSTVSATRSKKAKLLK